jgi:hypothetical protein
VVVVVVVGIGLELRFIGAFSCKSIRHCCCQPAVTCAPRRGELYE